jgi:hypothetical protein
MKNGIYKLARKLTIALISISLSGWLLSPALKLKPVAVAQTAGSPTAPSTLRSSQGEQAIQRLRQEGLYDSLRQAVEATRYELRWEERPTPSHLPPAYHAPNPSQRLDAYFTPEGIHLAPRRSEPTEIMPAAEPGDVSQTTAPWRATMKMIGYGYDDSLLSAAPAELTARGNRLEYRRAGITEWYLNTARGLEQGFTLADAPGSRATGSRLRLELELSGDLRAELVEDGRAITLRSADGSVALRYADLHAYDAGGRTLPSQMKASEGRVWLEVGDTEAVYPVTIDPLFTLEQKLWANEGSEDEYFGRSVALDESSVTAVAGAPFDDISVNGVVNMSQGSAYVFVRSGAAWNLRHKLVAYDGDGADFFGWSVAISGDKVVVGAPSNNDHGSVYVFEPYGSGWTLQRKLEGSGSGFDFGWSVSISADRLLVGAPGEGGYNQPMGAAYLFTRSNGSWSQPLRLNAQGRTLNDNFGLSVAVFWDTIVVGAPGDNSQGAAYIFEFNHITQTWSQRPKLTAFDGAWGDSFGVSVAVSGAVVIVGAPGDDINGNSDMGSAYVFIRNGSNWPMNQKLVMNGGAAGDIFGASVAIAGVTAVVGAPGDDVGANINQGSAHIFTFNGSVWNPSQALIASDGRLGDEFGRSVVMGGGRTTVMVGAPAGDVSWFPYSVLPDRGAAYVYAGN